MVDTAGVSFGTLTNARIGRLSHELNGPGAADVTLATTDPDALLLQPGRELQIWKDGTPYWWGPVVRIEKGLRESTWQAAGLLWYFEHRFFGRADRVNLLVNGDFEAGEASWTFHNGVGHSVDTVVFLEGTQSLELAGTSANHGQYASQTYTHTTQYFEPLGDALVVSVWVYVDSVSYLGGAVQDLGLVAIHRNADGVVYPDEHGVAYTEIGDDTPRDQWVPLEVVIPAVVENDTVEVRLFPPHGTAWFDLATLTLFESLGTAWPAGDDVATLIGRIVDYAQDLGSFTHGKSNLNIAKSTPATGTVIHRNYQFAEHRNIADAIYEFVRQGVCDISVEFTGTTRTFTVHTPKGSVFPTTLELDVNVADFSAPWDFERAGSSVVMLGPGDGPDRPEGGASDPAAFGGLTLEIVETAPDDATIGELDDRAAARLATASQPEFVELTTLPGAGIIGNLEVGDTVTVDVAHGAAQVSGTYRVVRMEIQPYVDQAVLTLNAP